jgi:mono/diheme cytochrome c family protein
VLCLAGVAALAMAHGKPWPVPEEFKKMKNPVAKDAAGMKAAAAVYAEKCAQCHGETGKGDGPEAEMYSTKPANFTDAAMMAEMTDGEIYYKMTEGRRPMPTFKKQLTDQQRWQLVHFIREFAAKSDGKKPAAPHKH